MVGFTTFSERSGEEAAFTLMQSLSKLINDALREQGGIVQGFTGDGIMAVFGAPVGLRTRRYGLAGRSSQFSNASRKPDLNSKPNTACDHRCALASTPERRLAPIRDKNLNLAVMRFQTVRPLRSGDAPLRKATSCNANGIARADGRNRRCRGTDAGLGADHGHEIARTRTAQRGNQLNKQARRKRLRAGHVLDVRAYWHAATLSRHSYKIQERLCL